MSSCSFPSIFVFLGLLLTQRLSSAHLSSRPPFSSLPVKPGPSPAPIKSHPCPAFGVPPESQRQPLPHRCPVPPLRLIGREGTWNTGHDPQLCALLSALPSSPPHRCRTTVGAGFLAGPWPGPPCGEKRALPSCLSCWGPHSPWPHACISPSCMLHPVL